MKKTNNKIEEKINNDLRLRNILKNEEKSTVSSFLS